MATSYLRDNYYHCRVKVDTDVYQIVCIPSYVGINAIKVYDFYIRPVSGLYSLTNMFSLPAGQQSIRAAMATAKKNAPDYVRMFLKDEWT